MAVAQYSAPPAKRLARAVGLVRRVPRVAWALLVVLAIGIAIVVLGSAFDWSGKTTIAVAGVSAFVFGALLGPFAFSRSQQRVTISRQVPEAGAFLPTGETTRTTVTPTNGR